MNIHQKNSITLAATLIMSMPSAVKNFSVFTVISLIKDIGLDKIPFKLA